MSGTPCVHMPGTLVASLLPVTQKLLPDCISLPHGLSSTDKIIFFSPQTLACKLGRRGTQTTVAPGLAL